MSITKRLHILQEDFNANPIKTINSFIQSDSVILNYTINNIVSDGYIIVDVTYKQLELDVTKIYFIEISKCKTISIKHKNYYVASIPIDTSVNTNSVNTNSIPICIPMIEYNKPIIPVTIKPIIGNAKIKYYGSIIDTPFHECNSQMFVKEHYKETDKNKDTTVVNSSNKSLFDANIIKDEYNKINEQFLYKSFIQKSTSQDIIRINSITDNLTPDKLYVISIFDIFKSTSNETDVSIPGFIACSKYREFPYDVLYKPIPNYRITNRKLNYMKQFMDNDYENYKQWLQYKL